MNVAPLPSTASQRRVSRLSLWLCLTLAWFAACVLERVAPHAAHKMLKTYALIARRLLVLQALRHGALRVRRHTSAPVYAHRLTSRRIAGAALRRVFRRGTMRERAAAICGALAEPKSWIARIARRLHRGFTRLRRLPRPRPTAPCAIFAGPQSLFAGANTS